MLTCLPDISLRHVEARRGKPRPGLLDEIEKPSGAAADVEERELALIASGKNLVQRDERLAADRIGGAIEQHLDLGVVALGGISRHPAAGLEVEILQVIGRALAACLLAQHLVQAALLAAAVDL